jgi:hypothetical protein
MGHIEPDAYSFKKPDAYSFKRRLIQQAQEAKDKAERLKPGPERDALLQRARQLDVACHIDEWIASPGLKSPK